MNKFIYIKTSDGDKLINIDAISHIDTIRDVLYMTSGTELEMEDADVDELLDTLEGR